MTPKEALATLAPDAGVRFQDEFSKLVKDNKHDVVVETGEGISTVYLLNNVEGMRLYSVDPRPWSNFNLKSDRHFAFRTTSFEALKEVFKITGSWDFFLHDGNHDVKGMTYDLEMAYGCVGLGGFIACDDYTWGEHKAWEDFSNRHDLQPFQLGSLMVAQKTHTRNISVEQIEVYHEHCLKLAEKRENQWLSAGNKNSTLFAI